MNQPPDSLTTPTIRAIKMSIKTISMQNLCGFLIFSTTPLSCLLDLNKSSLTFSTYEVSSSIFLSDYFINYPVIRMPSFQVFNPLITPYSYYSIYSSTFCHCFILASYIYVGSFSLVCLDIIRLLFFCLPGSSNCSLIYV